MKCLFIFIYLLLIFNIHACGHDASEAKKNTETPLANNQNFLLINGTDLKIDASQITGSGSLIAKKPLLGVDSSIHVQFDFTLSQDSSIELVTYADKNLTKGISIHITRISSDLIKLTINHSKEKILPITTLTSHDNEKESFSIAMDIHNHEKPPHILFWKGSLNHYSEDNAFWDSSLHNLKLNNGQGYFWGLILQNADLKIPSIEGAKFEH